MQVHHMVSTVRDIESSMLTQSEAHRGASCPAPQEGCCAWAEWPGNGWWYHARVKSVGADWMEVEWLRPPPDVECGRDVEYLICAVGDDSIVTKLGIGAVVPDSQPRPALMANVGMEYWRQHLKALEVLNSSFHELKQVSEVVVQNQQPKVDNVANQVLCEFEKSVSKLLEDVRQHGHSDVAEVEADGKRVAGSTENGTAREEEHSLRNRVAELEQERVELLTKLKAVDDDLDAARNALRKETDPECQLRFISQVEVTSSDVIALLCSRKQDAASSGATDLTTPGDPMDVAGACLASERLRRRQLEELLAGLKAALWGPDAKDLVKDGHAAEVRKIISRAGGHAEQAWKDMVQLAAEAFGDGGSLNANSEEMSRAATRYKEMRHELVNNLERLGKLEATAMQSTYAPPPRAQGHR